MADLIQARPTLYNGIRMRSRLEANFAQHFLDRSYPGRWQYEPECYASEDGQYLPDFVLNGRTYFEVKPAGLRLMSGDPYGALDTTQGDDILQRMEIIWASKPDARLCLVLWSYDQGLEQFLTASPCGRVWWWSVSSFGWMIWPGRGQREAAAQVRDP